MRSVSEPPCNSVSNGVERPDSSADRSHQSISRQLPALFAKTWQAVHGPGGYRYQDLVADPVPPLDTAYCTLGRRIERRGLVPPAAVAALAEGEAEKRQWALTHPLIAELVAAETVLIGAPMYNYSLSSALKTWIDRISFPGAFIDSATGANLLRDTTVVVVATRGGAYGPGTPRQACDFQTPYLRSYLAKQGVAVENIHVVTAEMTLAGIAPHLAQHEQRAAESLAEAQNAVIRLATRPSLG